MNWIQQPIIEIICTNLINPVLKFVMFQIKKKKARLPRLPKSSWSPLKIKRKQDFRGSKSAFKTYPFAKVEWRKQMSAVTVGE